MSDPARPATDDGHGEEPESVGDRPSLDDEPTKAVADDGMAPIIDNTGADDGDPAAPSG